VWNSVVRVTAIASVLFLSGCSSRKSNVVSYVKFVLDGNFAKAQEGACAEGRNELNAASWATFLESHGIQRLEIDSLGLLRGTNETAVLQLEGQSSGYKALFTFELPLNGNKPCPTLDEPIGHLTRTYAS
jgi:hypothetical protein